MLSVIQGAARGERGAMQSLYKGNKQKVWSIAYGLLLDQQQAASVTAAVFRDLWREIKLSSIPNRAEFTATAINKTAEMCAAAIMQKSPKAFQLPHDKNFRLKAGAAINTRFESETEYYLSNLPPLQRLIFVLHTVGGWGALRIARVLQWDSTIVRTALEAEADNFQQLQQQSGRDYSGSYEEILSLFAAWEKEISVPEATDMQILGTINSLVNPKAERAKRRRISIAAICGAILLLIVWAVLPSSAPGPDESNDSTQGTSDIDDATADSGEEEDHTGPATYDPPSLDPDIIYYAEIEIEEYGTITFKLDQAAAPVTCANFVYLSEMGFYDFLTFHSVTDGTMLQGGDPTINASITASNTIVGEFSENGIDNPLSHTAGAVSMVRSNDYDSASSAFNILRQDRTDLDGKYAVFGYVTEGMDVLERIFNGVVSDDSTGLLEEDMQPVISAITIIEEETEISEDDY